MLAVGTDGDDALAIDREHHAAGGNAQAAERLRFVHGLHPAETLATRTGMPFSTALPDATSTSRGGLSRLMLTPAWRAAVRIRVPDTACPHPCGSETTPGRMSGVGSAATSTEPLSLSTRTRSPAEMPSCLASSTCT